MPPPRCPSPATAPPQRLLLPAHPAPPSPRQSDDGKQQGGQVESLLESANELREELRAKSEQLSMLRQSVQLLEQELGSKDEHMTLQQAGRTRADASA